MRNFLNSFFWKSKNNGSLLLIFAFTVGILGILVTGLYFTMTAAMQEQFWVEGVAAMKKAQAAVEITHKSELERLAKDYISNNASQTLTTFDAAAYQTVLRTAESWTFPNTSLMSSGVGGVSVSGWSPTTAFLKGNTTAYDDFVEHPLDFAKGTLATATLTNTYKIAWSQKNLAYSKNFGLYKEFPMVHLPFSAAYRTTNLAPLNAVTMGGGPFVFLGGTPGNANPAVGTAYATIDSTGKQYPSMVSTWGTVPEKISSYQSSGTTYEQRQVYSLASGATIVSFNGSLSGAPTGFSTGTFDGQTRVIVDLSNASLSGKYYVNCTTAAAMAAGVVLQGSNTDESGLSAISIATNGMLYLDTYKSNAGNPPNRRLVQAATSYGTVGLADRAGYDGTSPSSALNFDWCGGVSAFSKAKVWISDTFNRNGTLPSSNGTGFTSNDSGVTAWSAVSGGGTLTTSTTGGGQLTASAVNSIAEISLGTGVLGTLSGSTYGGGLIGVYVTTSSFSFGKSMHVMFTDAATYDDTNSDKIDMGLSMDFSSIITPSYVSRFSASTYDNVTGTNFSYGGGTNIWGFLYSPSNAESFITCNNILVFKKKLTTRPVWVVPSNVIFKLDAMISVRGFSVIANPIGSLFASPQSAQTGSGLASFYGGVAVGEGIASSLSPMGTADTLNFTYKSAVGNALENYCERAIVHYPYFY